jgi:WD40 repeat protein
VRWWNIEEGRLLHNFDKHEAYISSLAFAPDGRYFASGDWDGKLRIWDVQSKNLVATYEFRASVEALSFSPGEGRYLLVGAGNDLYVLFNPMYELEHGDYFAPLDTARREMFSLPER